eukprot:m.292415 g.292415  ORF g.292415 m.292415 type:complete len:74 (+) comp15840_c0_seq2:1631-1852(+)
MTLVGFLTSLQTQCYPTQHITPPRCYYYAQWVAIIVFLWTSRYIMSQSPTCVNELQDQNETAAATFILLLVLF